MESYKMMATVYDELIREDVNYESIAEYILGLCNKFNISFSSYLDLACGTCNVGSYIGKKFKENYFVDLSSDMLIEADKKLRECRIKGKIVCQDMSDLNLNKTFDLITCVLDSTNYVLDENDLTNYFRGVYNHLNDDGLFVFDINSYYKISEILGNNIYSYNSEDIFYVWANIFEDEIVEMNLSFFIKQQNGLYKRFDEVHEERGYKDEFIEEILRKIGFNFVEKFDGYSNLKATNKSERITYIVRK